VSPEREEGNGQQDGGQRPDEAQRPDETPGPDETQQFDVSGEFGDKGDDQSPAEQPEQDEPPAEEPEQDEPPAEQTEQDESRAEEQDQDSGDEEPDEGDLEESEDGDHDEGDVDGEEVDEDEEEKPELSEEERLAELVSAPTQEWEGLEAAEAAADEPTVIQKAGSAITSSFEKVGSATTSGFKVVREHVGFPIWLRFLTASFLIVASIAAATSASLILYLSDIANALRNHSVIEGVDPFLTRTTSSGPQTIMIIGSDKRNQEISGKFGLSDTTMLLRLDPDRSAIALLSLPRDLKVDIPGVGTDKLNAAYSFGGPKLTLRTVKQLTGLQINHLVNVDFTGFARAVNAIGCVYVDVDHRYYHQNGPYASSSDYAEINLQPGYQALCGFDALSFVRYRHTDNDIVRSARQQAFLREARAKVPPERLIEDRKKLVKIFTTYTSSDIGSAEEMLRVLRLFFDLRGAQIKEIHFEGHLGPSYVTATHNEIQTAVDQFLGSESTPGPQGATAKPDQKVIPEQAPDATKPKPAAPSHKSAPSTDLVRTTYGKQLAQGIKDRKLKVPIFYPTQLEVGSDYAQKPRAYKINGKGDQSPPHSERAAYKWVFSLPTIGDYYGFMGTRWKDPPILDNPTDEKTIGDRDYKLFYDGDRLRMVAWQTDQGSFWLSNSYIETVSNADMLKIAQSFRQLPGT
jgi:polyisoprenyl-teichoic acid--peptidoglycan teichoic acid transferase